MKSDFQAGAVLLLCMLLLMALSLLGLAAASDSQMQQRVSGNLQQHLDRQGAAEKSLAWAEAWLMSLPGDNHPLPCSESCSDAQTIRPAGHYSEDRLTREFSWWPSVAEPAGFAPDQGTTYPIHGVAAPWTGYWLIEELHSEEWAGSEEQVSDLSWYRLTAASGEESDPMFSVVQSIVARPWGDAMLRNALPDGPATTGFCAGLPEVPCGRQAWQDLK